MFRVRGVPVRAHWALLLIVPYLAVTLSYPLAEVATLVSVDHSRLGALMAVAGPATSFALGISAISVAP